MKRYYDRVQAPLLFHSFLRFISLPIAFFLLISGLEANFQGMIDGSWLYTIDFVYSIVSIVLVLICFFGFFSWKAYAWYSIIAYLYVQVSYRLICLIVCLVFAPVSFGTYLGQLLGVLIYAILVGIYYKKRKFLFVTPQSSDNLNAPGTPVQKSVDLDPHSTHQNADTCNSEQVCDPCESVDCLEHTPHEDNAVVENTPPSSKATTITQRPVYTPYDKPKKNSTKIALWLIVALIIACLVIVGLCVAIFTQKSDPDTLTDSNISTQEEATAPDTQLPESTNGDVLASVAESVFYLEIYNENDECIGSASGFLVDSELTLVTNYHVVQDAHSIVVWTQDDCSVEANTLLAYDEIADLAVLRCSSSLGKEPLALANSDEVKQGMDAYAIGYPLGLANTISDGIISARYIDEYGNDTLQTTAAISNGNSGGPLLNEDGHVIGVMCAYYVDGQNLNVAISSNTLRQLLDKDTTAIRLSKWSNRPLMPDQEPIAEQEQEHETEVESIPEGSTPDIVQETEPDYEQEFVPEAEPEYVEPVVPSSNYSSLWDGTYDAYLFKVETETLDYLHDTYYVFNVANNTIEYTSGIYTYTFAITSIDETWISSYNIAAPDVVFSFYRHADGTVLMYRQQQAMYSEVLYRK